MSVELKANRETRPACSADFSQLLLAWDNPLPGRGLPWAFESDPYKVWISEIMLQQTQAKTVVPYFLKFIDRFPNVVALANAALDEVLKIWTGLGYYTRARNLHRAAAIVKDQYQGRFPANFDDVLALPGIGRSTAGAICALSYGMRTPILDGNAKRVYARVFCIENEKVGQRDRVAWALAEACTPENSCQIYTQFIMDLGATVCVPKNPKCNLCPLKSICCAKLNSLTDKLPLKRRAVARKSKSAILVLAMDESQRLLVERRPESGIWGGLWSLPQFSGDETDIHDWFEKHYAMQIDVVEKWPTFHHDFTHYRLNITPLVVQVKNLANERSERVDIEFISLQQPLDRGVPAPVVELIKQIVNSELRPDHS